MEDVKCIKCAKLIAKYSPDSKRYSISGEISKRLRGERRKVNISYPVIFDCRFHPSSTYEFDKSHPAPKEIKCPNCKNKKIREAKKGASVDENEGFAINIDNVRGLKVGNATVACPECNKLYNLEILRLEKKDISELDFSFM